MTREEIKKEALAAAQTFQERGALEKAGDDMDTADFCRVIALAQVYYNCRAGIIGRAEALRRQREILDNGGTIW